MGEQLLPEGQAAPGVLGQRLERHEAVEVPERRALAAPGASAIPTEEFMPGSSADPQSLERTVPVRVVQVEPADSGFDWGAAGVAEFRYASKVTATATSGSVAVAIIHGRGRQRRGLAAGDGGTP